MTPDILLNRTASCTRFFPNQWKGTGAAVRTVLVPHIIFALCLIVPVLSLCAIIGQKWVESEQVRSDARITDFADTIAEKLDRYLLGRVITLQILAASPSFDGNKIRAIDEAGWQLLDDRSTGILLRDGTGRVLFNKLARSEQPLTVEDFAALPLPSPSLRPQVSILNAGTGKLSPILFVEVPVVRGGEIKGFLGAVLMPPVFDGFFSSSSITGDLMGLIADRSGQIIARSNSSRAQVGQPLYGFNERVGEQGLWFGLSNDGVPMRVAYHRLADTGLLVNVGIPQAAFLLPLKRTLWNLGGLALALALGALVLSAPLIKRLTTAHRRLAETAELLSLAQEAAEAALWDWDIEGRSVYLSSRSAWLHGLAVSIGDDSTVVISTQEWEAQVFPEDLPGVWMKINRAIATRTTFTAEFRTRVSGTVRGFNWVQSSGRVVYDEKGRPNRLIGLNFDITAQRELVEALHQSTLRLQASEERLTLALDSGEDGLFDWNLESDELWVSQSWRAKLGFAASCPNRAREWVESVHPDDRKHFDTQVRQHLDGFTPCLDIEYRRSCDDGTDIWILARGRTTNRTSEGRALRMVGTLIDISRRKDAETRVAHMALHDTLTNLPNRNLFNQHLKEAAASSVPYAVLACDLDCFKAVNDTFGHPAGDRLLCLVAERICAVVRERDCVARLGCDEFAVILNGATHATATKRACERIIAAIGEPILFNDSTIHIGISIGVALVSGESLDAEQVFRRADTALYQAKADGRNTYRHYEAEAHARVTTRSLIALDMKQAIRRGDFSLVYQPIVDITTGQVACFEALMRWNHPERGFISPEEFIPVAEETGLILPLGAWALVEACREAMRWPDNVRVGVNVSTVQFNGDLEQAVINALAVSGLPVGRLKLEITESLLMQKPDQALATLHRLRAMGVRIALDDFGTGYSSLSYLRRFPFDKLKIDRAFVRDIGDPDAAAIVRAMVGIGERLGMGVVAEGVETTEQLDIVRREGCTEVQGFLFSKPLLPNDARAFVLDRKMIV